MIYKHITRKKLNIKYCDPVYYGLKKFELRKEDDVFFEPGMLIVFLPVDDFGDYVFHDITKNVYVIKYVLRNYPGIEKGYCIFGFERFM